MEILKKCFLFLVAIIFTPFYLLAVSYNVNAVYNVNTVKAPNQTRIMDYNLRRDGKEPEKKYKWGTRRKLTLKLITDFRPDILCVQEAMKNQLKDIKNALGQSYNYFGEGRKRKWWIIEYSEDEHVSIFYNKNKFKKLDGSTFWLNPKKEKGETGWGANLNRICTGGKFEVKKTKKNLWVFNTHLDNHSALARAEGLKLIITTIKEKASANDLVLLTGDFNEAATSENLEKVLNNPKYKMYDTADLAKNKEGVNWTAYKKQWGKGGGVHTIDYIFVNNPALLTVELYAIPVREDQQKPSDHNPIVVDFTQQ